MGHPASTSESERANRFPLPLGGFAFAVDDAGRCFLEDQVGWSDEEL